MSVDHEIDYENLAQEAMRGLVRAVLKRVIKHGLPGEHHFYIAFNTKAPGVNISRRLHEKYPEEMTIVLQHRFWDLIVTDERFEVKLTFDSIPERLVVPFAAVKVFFDPSVPYGLQFEESELSDTAAGVEGAGPALVLADGQDDEAVEPVAAVPAVKRRKPAPRKKKIASDAESEAANEPGEGQTTADDSEQVPAQADTGTDGSSPDAATDNEAAPAEAKVVSLDAFRKK